MNDSHQPSADVFQDLIARVQVADGSPPFSDGALVEYAQGARELVWEYDADGHPVGAALDSPDASEFVVDPEFRGRGHGARMLDMLTHPSRGGHTGTKLFWAHGDGAAARALAKHHKLEPVRELWHMTGEVPAGGEVQGETSSPRPDEWADWVELNGRAFAGHPEQGGVSLADLEVIKAEPWFSEDDVIFMHAGGRLVGYNWLKVDGGVDDKKVDDKKTAEIYVLGVDPGHQHEGIGRQLMDAGFARMREQGIHSTHLYVEGDNAPAIALYESLGYAKASVDIQYHYSR